MDAMSTAREIFTAALGLSAPWQVVAIELDTAAQELVLALDFPRGARFPCPACGVADQPVDDTETRRWQHLNFFQHTCDLKARQPRVRCATCGVKTVLVPWARSGSGFTWLFEAFALTLMQDMPTRGQRIGRPMGNLWRVLDHYVTTARDARTLGPSRPWVSTKPLRGGAITM